jgi:hypothetical protein
MEPVENLLAVRSVAYAWLAAAFSLPLALYVAVFGQGLGALLGGCSWIGISTPVTRPVWALVNQPSLDFAHLSTAFGYWWGGSVLCLLVGACAVPFVPRPNSIGAELLMLQLAWACTVIGGAWLPLLDLEDGQIVRWFLLHEMDRNMVWVVPGLAAIASLVPATRLLALARAGQLDLGRRRRLLIVLVHLGLPLAPWVVGVSLLRGSLPIAATIAVLCPLLVAWIFAWYRYPRPFLQDRRPLGFSSILLMPIAIAAVAGAIAISGRPLPEQRVSGLLWSHPFANNNIRPWITPLPLPGLGQPPPARPPEGPK